MLSTIGSFGAWKGFPVGTVVEYALDAAGKPIFAFSSLSSHTPDVQADPRCSITVTAAGFQVALASEVSLLFGGLLVTCAKGYMSRGLAYCAGYGRCAHDPLWCPVNPEGGRC